ncbi:BRCT domain-containing protein [Ponticaulis sp.]|uniref:BRCT domain-containing protein n=1 Tax=Ponticaulis sp. TaxID=2020902 RepID=UPI0025CEE122|nr:BRCT domain-containing protein [Ponticaulis sp.]|tara:strand:- start:3857 stop:4792 length:936 start_codon:yes stop_codon:yes gene_type:complete
MKLSEKIRLGFWERHLDENVSKFNKTANDRKKANYWIGFLEGALSSGRIEQGEPTAILKEAEAFSEFFDDPDSKDLIEDLNSGCFSSEEDLSIQLTDIIDATQDAIRFDEEFAEKDALNRFLGFCGGVVCDGVVTDPEIVAIRDKFLTDRHLSASDALSDLRSSIFASLSDNQIDENEREEIHEWLTHLVGDGYALSGKANIGDVAELDETELDSSTVQFENKRFVITGPTSLGTRRHVAELIEDAGGIFQQSITQQTNYVVVADRASPHWRTTHFGNKLARAHELIAMGCDIKILSETILENALARSKTN